MIPSGQVIPRDGHAAEDLEYDQGRASIYQPKLGIGLEIQFDAKSLDVLKGWR